MWCRVIRTILIVSTFVQVMTTSRQLVKPDMVVMPVGLDESRMPATGVYLVDIDVTHIPDAHSP
jgi:hypothetical protein